MNEMMNARERNSEWESSKEQEIEFRKRGNVKSAITIESFCVMVEL